MQTSTSRVQTASLHLIKRQGRMIKNKKKIGLNDETIQEKPIKAKQHKERSREHNVVRAREGKKIKIFVVVGCKKYVLCSTTE